ncbi:DUF742 domain-containing protein, partial [Streptomyces sp. NPDC007088]|uniref:DUF742 domain-containing protein n=1 Tax=Streptomyces sp. NPDC007088 TaxID=3364773 RepID=UPI00368D379C
MTTPPSGSPADWSYGQGVSQGDGPSGRHGSPSRGHRETPSYGQPQYGQQQHGHQQYDQAAYGRQGDGRQGDGQQPGPYDAYPYPHPGQQRPYAQPERPSRPAAPARGRDAGPAPSPLVRPYAMTGGRTRPRYQLAIEALVSTTAQPSQMQGQLPEHQRICNLCREIKSVAEISALLSIPLGVARILVADLAEAGLVAIHQPGGDENAGGQPDVT